MPTSVAELPFRALLHDRHLVRGLRPVMQRLAAEFADHPEQWATLGERPELAGRAVEECTRLYPSTAVTARRTVQDVVVDGIRISVDTHVTIRMGSANRDPAVFSADADTFDVTRERPAPLIFGAGADFCLGSVLARNELARCSPPSPLRSRPRRSADRYRSARPSPSPDRSSSLCTSGRPGDGGRGRTRS